MDELIIEKDNKYTVLILMLVILDLFFIAAIVKIFSISLFYSKLIELIVLFLDCLILIFCIWLFIRIIGMIYNYLKKIPQLKLNKDGIFSDSLFGADMIEWKECKEYSYVTFNGNMYIHIEPKDYDKFYKNMTLSRRLLFKFNKLFNMPGINIPLMFIKNNENLAIKIINDNIKMSI